jgi:hypothetical protein
MKKLFFIASLFFSANVIAVTECPRAVDRIFVQGNGEEVLWINFKNGLGSASITSTTSSNYDTMLSVVLAAKLADRNLIMRYAANGVDCNSAVHRSDLVGVWMW